MFLSVVFLAIAISIDGLGAGFACGVSRVRVPFLSVVLMGTAAGSAVLVSMLVGSLAGSLFNPRLAVLAGGILLICLGLFMLFQARGMGKQGGLLGLLSDPSKADADHSGSISAREAIFLGTALALDGFGAGFGAALAGFSPGLTGLAAAVTNVVFISAGLWLGWMASEALSLKFIRFLPGMIILILGVLKVFAL